MSESFTIGDDVKELVNKISRKNNLENITDIKYQAGSEIGDGYVSKTIAAYITSDKGKLCLFLKSALNVRPTDAMPIYKLYANEVLFYDEVLPMYLKFCESRGLNNSLQTIPKCYGTALNLVALENLREKDYVLCDRNIYMNHKHIKLVLKAFAEFHAISFVFKDKEKDKYEDLAKKSYDFFSIGSDTFKPSAVKMVNEFLDKLDPVDDEHLLDQCENLAEILTDSNIMASSNLNQYSVLTQGDCHCNNMMFRYEDQHKECPVDIMLVDWQLIRPASVAYDLSYFFYSIASKEVLAKQYDYLKLYHDELSKTIRLLGGDPDRLYPYEMLKKDWKQHSKYGFRTAFSIIKILLAAKDEVVRVEESDIDSMEKINGFEPAKLKKEEKYIDRMKMLLEHMITHDFLK